MTTIALLRLPLLGFRKVRDVVLELVTGLDAEDRDMVRDPQFIADMEEAERDIAAGRVITGEELRKHGLGGGG